jgi:hypothetical protein
MRSTLTTGPNFRDHLWPAGAQNWAVIASLIETCKLNEIEPHAYLSGVLKAVAGGHQQTDINLLLPWNYIKTV